MRINSFYRSRAKNAAVGGSPTSQHRTFTAVDIGNVDVAMYVKMARRNGLVAIDKGTYAHVQLFTAGALEAAGIPFSLLP